MTPNPTHFIQLNQGWNAEPNAPLPAAEADGDDLVLAFKLNGFAFERFAPGEMGFLRFHRCSRFRIGSVNDEGWYRGQCRFSGLAPKWGEFYEVVGDVKADAPGLGWCPHAPVAGAKRHFLFYFRDETFECTARDWSFDPRPDNALNRLDGAG